MSTSKLNLYNLDIGSLGWDTQFDNNMETIDDEMPTRLIGTLGQEIDPHKAVQIKSDGLVWTTKADGTSNPAIGIMFESGATSDAKRIKTIGLITTTGWSWTSGQYVYLSPFTNGELTQTKPSTSNQIQKIATAISSVSIFVNPS